MNLLIFTELASQHIKCYAMPDCTFLITYYDFEVVIEIYVIDRQERFSCLGFLRCVLFQLA